MKTSILRLSLVFLGFGSGSCLSFAQSTTRNSPERVAVGTRTPTETLDVAGTARLRRPALPTERSINTRPDGTMSPTANQTLVPTHSLWADTQGVLGRKPLPPLFFYLPPMLVPIYPQAVGGNTSYDATTQTFSTRIYEEYRQQFTRSNNRSVSSTSEKLKLYAVNELNYYVNYYDRALFRSVSVDASGVLRYQVIPGVEPTMHSYFGIVLGIKDR